MSTNETKKTRLTKHIPKALRGEEREFIGAALPYQHALPWVYGDGPEESPYYWWFQYLRRNENYLACCEKGGKGKFSKLYRDWGDVRTDDFESWFDSHCEWLFKEPEVPNQLMEITNQSQLKELDWSSLILVACPIREGVRMLSKREIKNQLSDFVDARFPNRKRGKPVYHSAARYRVVGQPDPRVLQEILAVYDLRKSEPALTLWEIGNRLHREEKLMYIAADSVLKKSDLNASAKKRRMAIAMSRHLKIARAYIANAAGPSFPKKK